jgi:hypothetical protein
MSTKYPNKIDTPAELPVVRDNIMEAGSDAINSLRSAIIQLEKVLGINPQGAVGMTVGDRISKSLDPSGNLKKEALDGAGVIYGEIHDDQISDVAAINEKKLKLEFPTKVLQSEISNLLTSINGIQSQVQDATSKLSAHLNSNSTNRHAATAISTQSISSNASQTAVSEIESSNVQTVLDKIFSSHINYDGASTSSTNKSHSASQVFFNPSESVVSSNVQDAIYEVSSLLGQSVQRHQDLLHSNGFAKSSYISDKTNSSYGVLLSEDSVVSILQNIGEKPYFEITLDTQISVPSEGIGIGDIVELTVNDISKEYQIYQIKTDETSGLISGFWLFGLFFSDQSSVSTKIFLKRYRSYNSIGIISSNRENYGLSSSNIVQIINPDAAFIISSGIKPLEINSSNRYINIKINGTSYSLDVYSLSASQQSIDSIVKSINETIDQLGLPILAYRKNKEGGGSELVIAHNISSIDASTSSLEIVRVDGAIDSLGFAGYESKVIYGQVGSAYYINGIKYTGLLKKLDMTGFDIDGGTRVISSGALAIDFTTYSIKKGDVINIIDTDVKSYEVYSVSASQITLSSRQLPTGFSYSSLGTARIIVYEASINADSLEFLNVGIVEGSVGLGASLLEIFLDSNRFLNTNLILEQESELFVDKSIYSVINFYNPNDLTSVTINFENTTDGCVEIWLEDNADRKKIVGNLNYLNVKSTVGNFSCDIYIQDKESLYNYADSVGGSFSRKIYPSESINRESNLIISNVHYSNFLGKFDAGINGALFIPRLNFGNFGEKDISTELKRVVLETPIKDLRSSGFIFGLEVTAVSGVDGYSSGIYAVDITDGVCYVDGKKFEISGKTALASGIDAATYDKLYIGINIYGDIVFSAPDPNCLYPWQEENILLIATIENDGVSLNIIDQRLFIDNLDLKLLNSITVSPQPGMGHFTSLPKAIKYAKRFSQIYKKAGVPEIHLKSGTHSVSASVTTSSSLAAWQTNIAGAGTNSDKTLFYDTIIGMGLAIDSSMSISGEGDGTNLDLKIYLTTSDYTDHEISAYLTVLGNGFNTTGTESTKIHGRFSSGVINFRNFKITKGTFLFADLNIYDGSTVFDFAVNINGVNVQSDFIRFIEASDSSNYKGNVLISNCKLYGGIIQLPFTSAVASRLKNLNISNNFFPIAASTALFVGSNTFFPAENNIVYLGNMSGVTTDTLGRKDRVAYDLFVPNNFGVGNDVAIGGSVAADSFSFNSEKSCTKIYYASQLRDSVATNNFIAWSLTFDPSITYGHASYSVDMIGTGIGGVNVIWPVINFENGIAGTGAPAIFFMPVTLDPQQTIKSISAGVENSNWTINIYKASLSGGSSTLGIDPYEFIFGPQSDSPNLIGGARIKVVNFNNIDYKNETSSPQILLISVQHDEADGVPKNMYYMKTTISQISVSTFID